MRRPAAPQAATISRSRGARAGPSAGGYRSAALFLGDTMTTRSVLTGVTGPKPAPFTLEPEQAVASLDRIEGVDVTWLLPGHGPAWDGGVPKAVRLIRKAAAESRT